MKGESIGDYKWEEPDLEYDETGVDLASGEG